MFVRVLSNLIVDFSQEFSNGSGFELILEGDEASSLQQWLSSLEENSLYKTLLEAAEALDITE